MKIAIFSDCYLDLSGGIVTAINVEKAELERRGHTVYVFSSAYPKNREKLAKLAKIHVFPVPSCRFFGRGLTPIARRPRVVERWILREHPEVKDFDVFYVHYEAGCSIAGLRLGRELGIPAVQVMHGREDVGEENLVPFGFRTLVATLLNWFHSWYLPHPVKVSREKSGSAHGLSGNGAIPVATTIARAKMWTLMVNHANFADLVLTPSAHFREKLVHHGVSKPVKVLHHGIPDELLKESVSSVATPTGASFDSDQPHLAKKNPSSQPLEIIWHSRVSPEKRILPFLEALKIVDATVKNPKNRDFFTLKNYHLSVYGSGVDEKSAKKYAKKHGLDVTFHGNSDFKTVWKALKNAHLDVLVSYDYDTFGMTLIEAAAAGVPTLLSDPALTEVLPKNSYFLASSPAPEGIAKLILEIMKNPQDITAKSQILLKNRAELSNAAKINRLEQIFRASKSTQ